MKKVHTSYWIEEYEGLSKECYRTAVVIDDDIERGYRFTYQDVSFHPPFKSDRDIASESLEWALLATDTHDGLLEYTGYPDVQINKIRNYHNIQPKLIAGSLNESVKELKKPLRAGLGLLEA
jgi:hypothetical protein